ncbi:hypothetical protein EcWSU1_02980 [Enterobacter ludwigii]|uniref:Uncharacterized protein n=1 Tax=Enterobacter ludwigii TaxID=299767 RepID=G8LIW8_9ENTR|nr:hypothetical protein EcWSU1_02980 [Enterobacter ludwigii]
MHQGQHLMLRKRGPARFFQHFACRIAVGGNHRHTDGERFAQDQRVVIHARTEYQRIHPIEGAHQFALVGFKPVIHHVSPFERRELAEGVQFNLVTQRHHVAHQLLIGFAVVTQVMRNDSDFWFTRGFCNRGKFGQNRFRRHVDTVIDDLTAPCPIQTVKGIGNVLAWGDKRTAEREHVAEQLALSGHQLMGTIHFHRRVVAQRRALLAVAFPAFTPVGKGAATGHAPVIVQRPDEAGIRFVGLHLLAKRHHLFQVQPVAVKHMEMQYNRPLGARHGAIKGIKIAKQIAVKQAEQGNVGHGSQARRVLMHLRVVIVADAFLTAFAITVNKTRLKSFLQRALMKIQRHTGRPALCETDVKLQNVHLITFTRAFSPTTSALSGILSSTTLPAPIVTLLPIVMSPMMTTFAPSSTLLPITGQARLSGPRLPMVTAWRIVKSSPATTNLLITTA